MNRNEKTPILDVIRSQMIADDATDYRAMLAREVWREEVHRTCSVRMSAADLTKGDEVLRADGGSLRASLEARNGEPL